ncbi:urease accessory protein UreE [Leptolyngbya sp. PCC 7375]|nr:urease accessory protein UreE [Leptolyngbya sp. PCC 7375]
MALALTADERTRSRYRYSLSGGITDTKGETIDFSTTQPETTQADEIYLELPRGTTLRHGDCLGGRNHSQVLKIVAKPEPVLTVRASTNAQPPSTNAQPPSTNAQPPSTNAQASLRLLQAAYHLGNRHVALEVGADYLRLAPDPVLAAMLHQLGVTVTEETVPFQPESGAYGHHH